MGKSLEHLLETQQTAASPAGLHLASRTSDVSLAMLHSRLVLYSTCRCTSACSRTDKTIAQILRTGRRTTRNPPSSTERASLLQRGSSCLRALRVSVEGVVVNKSPLPWAPGWAWGIGGLGSWSCRLPVFRNSLSSPDVPLVISRVAIVLGGTCGESPTIRDHACGWWGSRAFLHRTPNLLQLMRRPPGD